MEGILHCSHPDCMREYPIVDGIPLLIGDLRAYVGNSLLALMSRNDLSPALEGIIGDCCGPGSVFDTTRNYLSSYAWDHYGEFDPQESGDGPRPGCVVRVLDRMASAAGPVAAPVLDLGCSVGRSSFALADKQPDLVLGIDLNL